MTELRIPRRAFGNTGLQVSVIGLGGFHQVEIGQDYVCGIVEAFLGAGGNYVETARGYGSGVSERKLGVALQDHRDEVILVSKSGQCDSEGAWRELNESLEALRTDHLDVWLYHGLTDLKAIAGPGGAAEAFTRAREEGMVRFVGGSSHWPLSFLVAMECLELDIIMYWVNYLVACNYPELYATIAPEARRKGLGIIGMKPIGDGYLYRSPGAAFEYALSQEVDVLACGFNSLEMLREDIEIVASWQRPSEERLKEILRDAPELGDYVCRQCGACRLPELDLPKVFELEGKFDRQMFDGRPTSAPDYALRQRLCFWFNNQPRAIELYKPYAHKVNNLLTLGGALPECPYGIDLGRKLRLAHGKLTSEGSFPRGGYDF